jgi:aromatic-L-amino-acid decarboxylase
VVPVTPELRMDVEALQRLVKEDRDGGRKPFLVVASAGTTNTGAIDPLGAIGDVCETDDLWLHADAAYGGFFALTARGRARLAGIERADSITLDPHKTLFLPYGTGLLIVREGERLRQAHRAKGDYLQDLAPEGDIPNFTDYSPELSRDFRGFRVWLPLKLHGISAFRTALDEKLDLTEVLYDALRATEGFDVPWRPELTVVPFRYLPAAGDADAFNQRLLERINASKRIFLSSTRLNGDFWLRACIVSHRTHRDRVDEAIEIITNAARALDAS